jgi:hypothetical protein
VRRLLRSKPAFRVLQAAFAFGLAATASTAHAELLSATSTVSGQDRTITSVTTSEGTFTTSQMVNIDVTHFRGASSTWVLRADGAGLPATGSRAALLEDFSLSTGLPNVGGSATAGITAPPQTGTADPANNTTGMAFDFLQPIVNNPGVDIVIFDVASTSSSQTGDPFALSLLDGSAHHAYVTGDYNIILGATNLRTATGTIPRSLNELENNSLTSNAANGNFDYRGIGIDLDDLNVPAGGSVSGLYMTGMDMDPTLIVGLVPEPGSAGLLLIGAGLFATARRRRAK